jgi:uncharacterized protein YjiS (DUF1127 family)
VSSAALAAAERTGRGIPAIEYEDMSMSTTTLRSAAGGAAAWDRYLPGNLMARMRAVLARHASRQALARMDVRLLADIGLTREQALREAAKPFWVN